MAEQIALRPFTTGDLPILFEQQHEPEAIRIKAFTAKGPTDLIARFQQRFWAGPGWPVERTLEEGDAVEGFVVLETPGHAPACGSPSPSPRCSSLSPLSSRLEPTRWRREHDASITLLLVNWPVCLAGLDTIDREQWEAYIAHFS